MAQLAWNSGALGAEIACEDEKTVRIHRAAACLTAPPSAETVTNREKGHLKFLYPAVRAVKRIRIGKVSMAGLPVGQWRYLPAGERF